MKVVITPRFFENKTEQLMAVESKYYPFFEKHGYSVHLIPFMGIKPRDYLEDSNPDVVVFAGGYRLYTDEIKKFETEVLQESLKKNLPILAICCGMWTVNYYFKGTLKFDESHQAFDGEKINFTKRTHSVRATDFVEQTTYTVNSYHSKVIDKLGEGLKSFLIAKDNVIEGFYNVDKRTIGIQFHMENKGVSGRLTSQIMKRVKEL